MSVRNLFTKAELRAPVTRAAFKKIKQSGLIKHLSADELRLRLIKQLQP